MAAIYEDNFGFWEIDCRKEHPSLSTSRVKAFAQSADAATA
jgi:hypothetical protein